MQDLQVIAERLLAAFNRHDPKAVAALYSPDQVTILPGMAPIGGRIGKAELLTGFFQAFPDLTITLSLVLVSGRHIVCEGTMGGRNTGPLPSPEGELPPTGRTVKLPIAYILAVDGEGLIQEDRTYFDNAAFHAQLSLAQPVS